MRVKTQKTIDVADDYLALIRRFPLRKIRTLSEYELAAGLMIELALRAQKRLSAGESDYMDVLGEMISEYDRKHSSILKMPKSAPIEILKYLMQEHGMNTVSLGKLVGGNGQASMILNGKRQLSKANIRKLAERFKVSPALFI